MTEPAKSYGSITPYGYRRIQCKDRKQRFEHVIIWESHYGPVPEGFELHHRNGDKLDNRIENLKLVSRLEHKRIHSGCIKVGKTWLKRCRCCRWYRSIETDFHEYKGRNGVMGACKRCLSDLAVIAKRKRKQRANMIQSRG